VIFDDEFAESVRRSWKRRIAKLGNPLSNFGIGERAIDLFVEPFDDVSGRILGRSEALQLGWYRRMTCRMVRMLAPMPPWQVSLRSCGLGSLG
jgi:hypothetical protein